MASGTSFLGGWLRSVWQAIADRRIGRRYPGDFSGTSVVRYSPKPNGHPDPGEIVWAWVPFEEDHAQGKDRPVLLVGRDGKYLLGLMLTSKRPTEPGRPPSSPRLRYLDLGAGAWDRQGRASAVRLDRVLRIDPTVVRREGAVLERSRYALVADSLRSRHGWR